LRYDVPGSLNPVGDFLNDFLNPIADFLNMMGEAANSARVNMSNVATRALENWLLLSG